jgi:predicted HTH transcriptional regulator
MLAREKMLYEEFARFFENPTRETLRELLKKNVGELPYCDFKEQWPEFSKLARHLLGLANSGGGCIIIGVAEREDKTFEPKGVDTLMDKADILNGVKRFLPPVFINDLSILDFAFDASEYPTLVGKKFQVVFVEDNPRHLPFVSTGEADGICRNTIYVRRATSTDEANYEELQRIINKRLETGYSSQREIDLGTHIEQLKLLFRQVDRYNIRNKFEQAMSQLSASISMVERVSNPKYPNEDFEAFIVRMIERKKKRIEIELDVVGQTG